MNMIYTIHDFGSVLVTVSYNRIAMLTTGQTRVINILITLQ